MTDLAALAMLLGWALLPFIISVVYGCTHAGNKKIAWILDVFAVGLGVAAFAIVRPLAFEAIDSSYPPEWGVQHWWAVAANLIGFLACAVVIVVAYVPLYSGAASAPAAADAH